MRPIKEQNSVFIGKLTLKDEDLSKLNSQIPRDLFIFGATVKTGEISVKYGELKKVELLVIEKNIIDNTIITHNLAQHDNDDSILFKRESDKTQEESVDMLNKKDIQYLNLPPKWKITDMTMPKVNNKLFFFAKQYYIPENETTKAYIGWDETLYFFVYVTNKDELLIQMFPQDTSTQSAEDHYKLEILIGDYIQNRKNLKIVRKLLTDGDKHFYEYLLNDNKLTQETLELMLELAKTKSMKAIIAKRLR